MKISKIASFLLLIGTTLNAYTLKESINKVLEENPEVIAEKKNQEAFKKYVDERKGNYLPRIDIDGRLEKSNSDKDYYEDDPSLPDDNSEQEDGYNLGIALNQMLYDGELTPSRVREAKHNDLANKYRTNLNIENVVLETIDAYMGLVQYKELLYLSEDMIKVNENNLEIAKEKEVISGEVLETYQVASKLNFAKEKYIEEKDFQATRESTFKRYLGVKPQGDECRPQIDESVLPKDLETMVKKAVLSNYEILEQIERVKAQREKIAQSDASFLPTLNLELRASTDKDLSLDEEGIENQAVARLNLSWNLYNGGADTAVSKQEELFLSEQKKRLDAITNKIVENVKVTYQRFQKNKERIEVLKEYVVANENIVDVYKSEFEAGTRTFVDILNAQTDLYEARQSLINREYDLYSNYYELLNALSILSDTIQKSDDSQCVVKKVKLLNEENKENEEINVSEELNELLEDDIKTDTKNVDEGVESLLDDSLTQEETTNEVLNNEVLNTDSNISKMLNASKDKYTLNLGTTKGIEKANEFISLNSLDNQNSFAYSFGSNKENAKVIYGIFDSIKDAKNAIKNLPTDVLKNQPYVDNISKHQNLYRKYHE